ncbi:hypothetical protein BD779DRAFT_1470045 [Infundibulicybe gibba]|nr:hypothetical protein BD779DRAFT_1470045 [Infundibulicybe gibba]
MTRTESASLSLGGSSRPSRGRRIQQDDPGYEVRMGGRQRDGDGPAKRLPADDDSGGMPGRLATEPLSHRAVPGSGFREECDECLPESGRTPTLKIFINHPFFTQGIVPSYIPTSAHESRCASLTQGLSGAISVPDSAPLNLTYGQNVHTLRHIFNFLPPHSDHPNPAPASVGLAAPLVHAHAPVPHRDGTPKDGNTELK